MSNQNQVTIEGIRYLVLSERAFHVNGKQRAALFLRRLNGKRTYHAVRYENGSMSGAV